MLLSRRPPLRILICHDTTVTIYAAYVRIYEPVSAFHQAGRIRWAAYAASSARPRRRESLMAEHARAPRRAPAFAEFERAS
jgi:hypothetical protein